MKRDLVDIPLVTVVTVTRNCIDQFGGTIRNILCQDYPNLEIIVVDGRSTDGTLDLICQYADYIDLWVSDEDDGPYNAMNRAADLANGRYIQFMSAGDWYIGEEAVSRAIRNVPPDTDFIIGHHIYRLLDGTEGLRKANSFETTWRCLTMGKLSYAWLSGIPCHQATLTRTQTLREHKYDTRFRIAADHEFMYRLRCNGARFYHCDTVISLHSSGGFSARNQLRCLDEWIAIANKYGPVGAAEGFFGPARTALVSADNWGAPLAHLVVRAELEALRARAHAAEERAERYRAEADALQASTSWRITGPLRRIRRLLG
jgi:glycosyltransferase involved in cell wall biosynthesis